MSLFPKGNWQRNVAAVLDVNVTTVRRWLRARRRRDGQYVGGAPRACELALECMLEQKQGRKARQ